MLINEGLQENTEVLEANKQEPLQLNPTNLHLEHCSLRSAMAFKLKPAFDQQRRAVNAPVQRRVKNSGNVSVSNKAGQT